MRYKIRSIKILLSQTNYHSRSAERPWQALIGPVSYNLLVLQPAQEHVVVRGYHQTDVTQEAIASTVHKLQHILLPKYQTSINYSNDFKNQHGLFIRLNLVFKNMLII